MARRSTLHEKIERFQSRPFRNWRLRNKAIMAKSTIIWLGLAALITVGGNRWSAQAATNRFVATNGSDTSNTCSNSASPCATIQHAVDQAASGDVIQVAAGTYVEVVMIPDGRNLTIQGDPVNGTIVNGNGQDSVFTNFSSTVTLSGLIITGGLGGFAHPPLISAAGGISNVGDLTVIGCEIFSNEASADGAEGDGGGIYNQGNLTVINSTIHDNVAGGVGGGIANSSTAVTTVNSTIVNNTASPGGGSGVANLGTFTLQNTIIASNLDELGNEMDCLNLNLNEPNVVHNHDLISDGTCGPTLSGDPKLGTLQNNGGNTSHFYPLLAGSPAIDAGDDSVVGSPLFLTTDQRGAGFSRKSGAHVDIGAYEAQQVGSPPPVFDTCLRDNSTGNGSGYLLEWNSTTGQYKFTRCSDGLTLTGTGVVSKVNGLLVLTDSKPDRKISAGFNPGQRTGAATIYRILAPGVFQVIHINDTNPSAVCSCQ